MLFLARAFRAETFKLKRTLALTLAFIAPGVVVLLHLAMYLMRGQMMLKGDTNPWPGLIQNSFVFWFLLMLPLFVTLQTALLNQMEHTNRGWTHLGALPAPRWAIYTAKQLVALVLLGLSFVLLAGYVLLLGQFFVLVKPSFGFDQPAPWKLLLEFLARGYLASFLIIAIHHWVSARWSSFVVAMSSGIAATVAGVMIIQSETWWSRYPWTLPGRIAMGFGDGARPLTPLLVGLIGGIIAAAVGCWDVTRRDIV